MDPVGGVSFGRRNLPLYVVWFSLLPSVCGGTSDFGPAAALQLGPLLGHTTSESARIWIKATAKATSAVLVAETQDFFNARVISGPILAEATDFSGVIDVGGLRAQQRYFYRIMLNGNFVDDAAARFTSQPPKGSPARLRLAMTSCESDINLADRSWQAVSRASVDLVAQLGDNAYIDSTDPHRHRGKFYSHRANPAYRHVTRGTSTLAIWDDLDFAGDNTDGTETGKQGALKAFQSLWANPTYGESGNPGVYFKTSWGDIDLFMLDVRYHRSPNDAADDEQETMLGALRLRWLKRELSASRAAFKLLASGSQWHSKGKPFDSWSGYLHGRNDIFDFIRANAIEGVVLLSGDRHLSAGYWVDKRFVEITSSPIASENHEPSWNPDEMPFLNYEGSYFVVLDFDTTAQPPTFTAETHRVGEGLVRQRHLNRTEVNGKTPLTTCEFLIDCRQ
jgi:alkaline phosphatase D